MRLESLPMAPTVVRCFVPWWPYFHPAFDLKKLLHGASRVYVRRTISPTHEEWREVPRRLWATQEQETQT